MRCNKFIHSFLLILVIVIISSNNYQNTCARIWAPTTTSSQKVTVKIIKSNKRYIKIKLVNRSYKAFYYYGGFTLKKLKGKKWKRMKYYVAFPKTSILQAYSTKVIKFKWKKYYGKNLSKGKYKIDLVKTRKFSIK